MMFMMAVTGSVWPFLHQPGVRYALTTKGQNNPVCDHWRNQKGPRPTVLVSRRDPNLDDRLDGIQRAFVNVPRQLAETHGGAGLVKRVQLGQQAGLLRVELGHSHLTDMAFLQFRYSGTRPAASMRAD
jgi:hypothetical protein